MQNSLLPLHITPCDKATMISDIGSDKSQCTMPNILPAYNFLKAGLSGNRSVVAGR